MNKCLSPERGEKVERLYFRDGMRWIAEQLVRSYSREEMNLIHSAGTGIRMEVSLEQGPSFQSRLLRRAVRREVVRRMEVYG